MSCGNGKRERTVKCSGGRGRCDSRSEPQATTSCNLGPCPEWKVGEWSQVKIDRYLKWYSRLNGIQKRFRENNRMSTWQWRGRLFLSKIMCCYNKTFRCWVRAMDVRNLFLKFFCFENHICFTRQKKRDYFPTYIYRRVIITKTEQDSKFFVFRLCAKDPRKILVDGRN